MSEHITMAGISARMAGQDNLATLEPIFIVQQKRRIYGLDPNWSDHLAWLWDGSEVATDEKELEAVLRENDMSQEEAEESGVLVQTGYLDTWVFVQPFFSAKGAEAYIESNRHNLQEPRVYVGSAYRNDEWQAVRSELLSLEKRSCFRVVKQVGEDGNPFG